MTALGHGHEVAGRYRITRRLASGGMGTVYLAEQRNLQRTVALKVLHGGPSPLDAGSTAPRWLQEATLASRLTHPHIVRVFDCGQTDEGLSYIAMEYVDGPTLAEVVQASAPLPPPRVVALALQLCGALTDAHDSGVVHRDLKPSNIIVTPLTSHGFVRVLDFGLAMPIRGAHPHRGGLLGSPAYMAPEQIRGDRVGPQADLYALGVVMYLMLTGRLPFAASSVDDMLDAHLHTPVPPMDVSGGPPILPRLAWLTHKLLEKRPEDRFPSASTVAAHLRGCLVSERDVARPSPARRRALALGLLAAVGVMLATVWWAGRPGASGPVAPAPRPAPTVQAVAVPMPVSPPPPAASAAPRRARRPATRPPPAPPTPAPQPQAVAEVPPSLPPHPRLSIDQVDLVDPFAE